MDSDKLMGWSLQPVKFAVAFKGCDGKLCTFQFVDFHHEGRRRELKGDTITANNMSHCNLLVLRVLGPLYVTCRG